MKKIKIFFVLLLVAIGFASCEDDALKATLKSDAVPGVLQDPSSESFVLTKNDKDEVMETFEWTAPDYGFTASVTYKLQIAIAGTDFASPVDVASINNLHLVDIKVGAFNEILLGLGFTPEQAADIDVRIVSSIGSNVPTVYSNTQTISVTPYATSFPPIYGMGAGLKGWGPWPGNAVEWQSSEYKKYETVAYFTGGEIFRWFAQLDWGPVSYNYNYFTTVDPIFALNPGDNDNNLKIVGPSGWYKVNVDLAAKTVAAEAVDEPVLYMMGAALNGWGPWNDKEVKMTYIKPGIFEATATFSNEIFRFFGQADWGPTSYNYNYFTSVDDDFELNAGDNDNNFRYIGTPGSTKITVDLNAKTVVLGNIPDPVLFITGDDFGWGWNDGQYVQMTYKGSNTFEATANLTTDKLFRFFPQKDWSPSYNFSYFTTVDSELQNQGTGTDENFKYVGATGSRKITVNMTTKVVSID